MAAVGAFSIRRHRKRDRPGARRASEAVNLYELTEEVQVIHRSLLPCPPQVIRPHRAATLPLRITRATGRAIVPSSGPTPQGETTVVNSSGGSAKDEEMPSMQSTQSNAPPRRAEDSQDGVDESLLPPQYQEAGGRRSPQIWSIAPRASLVPRRDSSARPDSHEPS